MPFRAVVAGCIILALFACGKQTLPQKPQLVLDRDELVLDTAWVGTKPQSSLAIENGGLETLTLSSVTMTGDPAFTLDPPPKSELRGKERTFLRIIFSPTKAKKYVASITIVSNAENAPQKVVNISAEAVNLPDGGG